MREKTVHAGIYYGWLIVATTFWMAIFTGGEHRLWVFVLPMSEELGWSRGPSRWQPLSERSSVVLASLLWASV